MVLIFRRCKDTVFKLNENNAKKIKASILEALKKIILS